MIVLDFCEATILSTIQSVLKKGKIYVYGCGESGKTITRWMENNGLAYEGVIDRVINNTCEIGGAISKEGYFWISSFKYMSEIKCELEQKGVVESHIIGFENRFSIEPLVYANKRGIVTEKRKIDLSPWRNAYKGERAFIIGNGPSLSIKDLDCIKNELTFATNEIFCAFSESEWRPTFYFCEDIYGARLYFNTPKKIEYMLSNTKAMFASIKNSIYDQYSQCNYDNLFFYMQKEKDVKEISENVEFSRDINEYVVGCGTTVYSMYQFAIYMGVKKIFLLGMDCSFAKKLDVFGNVQKKEGMRTHASFIKEHEDDPMIYDELAIISAHKSANKNANDLGINIYNATRGGELEVFERVDFDSLF